jgi:hypothetical protein
MMVTHSPVETVDPRHAFSWLGFPSAYPTDEGYVLALLDVFSISQLQYLGLIQAGNNAEIQLIQCAQDREVRFPYQTLPTIDTTLADFLIQESQ